MPQEGFKRKLTAILSADVEGYSRLMEGDELATVQTLTSYKETMRKQIKHYRGRVVDSTGDNLLAEFASVVDAVQCAVEVQQVLNSKNDSLPENRRMFFRIGINLGDVLEEGDRIFGDGVNIAARIESLADGGGICISGTAYDQIKNKLALAYDFLGEHTVKNISDPVRVYKVPMGPVEAKKKIAVRGWRKTAIAAAVILILGGGALGIWHYYFRPPPIEPASLEKMAFPLPDKPSIAVLPFVNIGGDPKEDYLSDGITEQIITALSKTPKMLVIARNSVFTYKGKPVMVQQVSEELGVRYVLEGSVQKEGDRLRITAQLIDAKTGNHLWSERYDRDLKDLFDLQDDITKNVITALQVKLTDGQIASNLSKGTKNLKAYLKVMKGAYHFGRRNSNDNEIARQFFEEAIELDPNYANAYTFLGWTYNWEAFFRWTKTPAKSYSEAVELAKKAISLDGQNAYAYGLLANAYVKRGQFEKAIGAGKKSLSLQPSNAQVNFQYGNVLHKAGKSKEGIRFLKKAIRLDPKFQDWALIVLGWAYYWTGQNEKAVTALRKNLSHKPKNANAHASLGGALIATGKLEEAIAMFEQALNLTADRPIWYTGSLAVARLGTGKPEEAIKTMQDLVSRHPDDAEGYAYLSGVLSSEGKYEEAFSMAKKAISLKAGPSIRLYYWWLGIPYLMIGEYEEAITAFKKAISLWPEVMNGHIGLTASYSLAGRVEEARAQAAEVLKINPKITSEDIAKNGYYNFKKADKERFINALSKAGLK